ncbi:capsule assembly Wzi family protein [Rubrolithibacter danxiaensis]|uniref:capsule assembly Wzi family protein n=1 Tax=Rubrolithibacter danxiaensis TaxID=3390805 RepID=UPI003BF8B7CB
MNDKRFYTYIIILFCYFLGSNAYSQSLPVGITTLEDYYRKEQLEGNIDSTVSFTIRPLSSKIFSDPENVFFPDTFRNGFKFLDISPADKSKTGEVIKILPLTWYQQYNSSYPYGRNDGLIIPAKGYQTLLTGGFYLQTGKLSIQFMPEIVMAQNASFNSFPSRHYPVIWQRYYNYYNFIDLPERFGNKTYANLDLGQSYIQYNFRNFSAGLSNENLWWGPGQKNSLLLSNNAPGFKHLSLNTNNPYKTVIGSFEAQYVFGKLDESGFTPPESDRLYLGTTLYHPKPIESRYISGLVVTYQPKWVPGLFVGLARTKQLYGSDIDGVIDLFPIFNSFRHDNADTKIAIADKYASLFMRWFFKEEQAEVYFEYGRNDQSQKFMDYVKNPGFGRAYIVGVNKLFDLNKGNGTKIQVALEVTQLQQSSKEIIKDAGAWYVDKYVRHGYTNQGQVLGAGIGPGSNLQSLDVCWWKGMKKIGIRMERLVHNNDFYYYAFEDSKDFRRHWIDLNVGVLGEWNYKNLLLSAKLIYTNSLNYQWDLKQSDPNTYFVNGKDVTNFHASLGVTYRF